MAWNLLRKRGCLASNPLGPLSHTHSPLHKKRMLPRLGFHMDAGDGAHACMTNTLATPQSGIALLIKN